MYQSCQVLLKGETAVKKIMHDALKYKEKRKWKVITYISLLRALCQGSQVFLEGESTCNLHIQLNLLLWFYVLSKNEFLLFVRIILGVHDMQQASRKAEYGDMETCSE